MTLIKIKEGTKILKSRYVAETNELRGMLINTFFKIIRQTHKKTLQIRNTGSFPMVVQSHPDLSDDG